MENNVINLADKSGNCKHWSVLDMLQDAIETINQTEDDVPDKAILIIRSTLDDGRIQLQRFYAGVTADDVTAILALELHRECALRWGM